MQWATYYDAADEAGISRLWGGIHPRADDLTGRTRGDLVGVAAFNKARDLYIGYTTCNRLGDVNQDTRVDGLDIAGFLRAKLGFPPQIGENQHCADYNTGTLANDMAAFIADLMS